MYTQRIISTSLPTSHPTHSTARPHPSSSLQPNKIYPAPLIHNHPYPSLLARPFPPSPLSIQPLHQLLYPSPPPCSTPPPIHVSPPPPSPHSTPPPTSTSPTPAPSFLTRHCSTHHYSATNSETNILSRLVSLGVRKAPGDRGVGSGGGGGDRGRGMWR